MSNSIDQKPDNFDWVTARAECSIVAVFEKLKILIETDVEIRNKLRQKDSDSPIFKLVSANNRFTVLAEGHYVHKTVVFALSSKGISAISSDGHIFQATVTLCNDGICRAKIGEQEYDLWQLRKMALEDLFFREYGETD